MLNALSNHMNVSSFCSCDAPTKLLSFFSLSFKVGGLNYSIGVGPASDRFRYRACSLIVIRVLRSPIRFEYREAATSQFCGHL